LAIAPQPANPRPVLQTGACSLATSSFLRISPADLCAPLRTRRAEASLNLRVEPVTLSRSLAGRSQRWSVSQPCRARSASAAIVCRR